MEQHPVAVLVRDSETRLTAHIQPVAHGKAARSERHRHLPQSAKRRLTVGPDLEKRCSIREAQVLAALRQHPERRRAWRCVVKRGEVHIQKISNLGGESEDFVTANQTVGHRKNGNTSRSTSATGIRG
jgi:hypothetical protein